MISVSCSRCSDVSGLTNFVGVFIARTFYRRIYNWVLMSETEQEMILDQIKQSSNSRVVEHASEPENLRLFRAGYVRRADNFREMIVLCLDEADDNQKKKQLFELLCELSKEFLKRRQAITDTFGCPAGYDECPDGSCIPKGQPCESEALLRLLS